MREHVKKKKKNFSSWFNTPRSIRFTIVRSPGIRFNDSFSSGFLSRIKKKKRKKDSQIRFVPFVKIILRYIIDCYEGEKRTNDRDRYKCVTSAIVPQKKKCLRIRNKRVSSTFVRLNRWQSPQCCRLVSGSTEEREFRWVPSSGYYFVLMLRDDHAW